VTYWLKIVSFLYPSHLAPLIWVTPFEFMELSFTDPETTVFHGANG